MGVRTVRPIKNKCFIDEGPKIVDEKSALLIEKLILSSVKRENTPLFRN